MESLSENRRKTLFSLARLALWGGVTSMGGLFVATQLAYFVWWWQGLFLISYSLTGIAISFSLCKVLVGENFGRPRLFLGGAIGGIIAGICIRIGYSSSDLGQYILLALLIVIATVSLAVTPLKRSLRVMSGGIIATLLYTLGVAVSWYTILPLIWKTSNYVLPVMFGERAASIMVSIDRLLLMLRESIGFYLVNLGMLAAFWKDLDSKA